MYDIFYIGPEDEHWKKLKQKFPLSKRAANFQIAQKNSFTVYFWVVWHYLQIADDFNFNYKVSKWDEEYIHVFRNGNFYDGVCLFPKKISISNRELQYRFFTNKKEIDVQASTPKPFDVVFISYYEPNADVHYSKLTEKLRRHVYRVNGVKGIHNAHIQAATLVSSDLFWVVDADAILETDFNFEFPQVVHHDTYTKSTVHVWTSCNPINDLQYGNGGVKLLPRKLTLNMDLSKLDMTTSISPSFKSMPEVSNITAFNTDEFTTWRSAFRECVKLSSKTIQGQINIETEERLNVWCSVGKDRLYGKYAISGALAGRKYGQENTGNLPALTLINDYDWLREKFEQSRSLMETHLQ